jgi:hypothetical protein
VDYILWKGGDMYISRGFKFLQGILVILVSLVFLTISPSNGYGDDWVKIDKNDNNIYFKPSRVTIDKNNNIIEVWIKKVFTNNEKYDVLVKLGVKEEITLMSFNYKEMTYILKNKTLHSKSGNIIEGYCDSDVVYS